MVVLRHIDTPSVVEEGLVEEKFEGSSGRYWKSGDKGTATMFSSWVRANIRDMTTNNSVVKTCREFVQDKNGFEELVMSFGRKDEKPLDIHVGVAEDQNSYIGLEYFKNPMANKRDIDTYVIRNPMSLSVDPVTKKLVSVVFKGPQFSFAGQKKNLTSIPGYTEALKALSTPIRKAASILDTHDSTNYKSRNLNDFEGSPEVMDLKDLYKDWRVDVDTSKLASANKVTYIFTHPTNPDFNFTVYFQDEGGGKYKSYAFYLDHEMSVSNLNKRLEKERERLANEPYSEYESYNRTDELVKKKISGDTKVRDLIKDTDIDIDTIVKNLNKAIDDPHIDRYANLDITRYNDKEVWELSLKTQHGNETLTWEVDLNEPRNNTVFKPNSYFNDVPTIPVRFNTSNFYDIIHKQVEKFRKDYGVFKTFNATVDPDTGTYIDADYDLANWADFVLNAIEPDLNRLQDKYNLVLNQETDPDSMDRDRSGKLLFTGNYVDRSFADHLLELRINYDRGEKFIVWIRPDLKGGADTKAEGQTDLSFFNKWVEDNVAPRSLKMDSASYRSAIEKELLNMGGTPGHIRGTIDVSTPKIKPVTIDLKVTNNKVLVTAYRDNKVVARFDIEAGPFSIKPKLMAKDILSRLSKMIKESFPYLDRQYPNLKKYVEELFRSLESEGIKKVSENNIQARGKSYIMNLDQFGTLSIKNPMSDKVIKESMLIVDPEDREEDLNKIKSLF